MVVDACEQASAYAPLYSPDLPIADKVDAIAKHVYGARNVDFLPTAVGSMERHTQAGLASLPACMAKTHLSLSADPKLLNAPTGSTLPVRDLRAYTVAGWIVALCGDIQTMPGLGLTPGLQSVNIEEEGQAVGLF